MRSPIPAALLLAALGATADAQAPDSTARRDSASRAYADSLRQSELARIRGEPRASASPRTDSASADRGATPLRRTRVDGVQASVTTDLVADLSPGQAARRTPSRIALREVEIAGQAAASSRVRATMALSVRDRAAPEIVEATGGYTFHGSRAELRAGRAPVRFGRQAWHHRHELDLADYALPVRSLLTPDGLRGTGVLLHGGVDGLGGTVSYDAAITDRFGSPVDSLVPTEPPDQTLLGVAASARLGGEWSRDGIRYGIGGSIITGKREQPLACVFRGTIGPVPCPGGVTAANARLTVVGADASLRFGTVLDVEGEILHLAVGSRDRPVFELANFTPLYTGLTGRYTGAYVQAKGRPSRHLALGVRAEGVQNPAIDGLGDGAIAAFASLSPAAGTRIIASYERRLPSAEARTSPLGLTRADARALDRVVIRGSMLLGSHPGERR